MIIWKATREAVLWHLFWGRGTRYFVTAVIGLSHCSSNHNFRSDRQCGFFWVICNKPLCHLHAQWLRGLAERHKEIKVKPKQSSDCVSLSVEPFSWCPTASVSPSLSPSPWSTDVKASCFHLSCHLTPSSSQHSPATHWSIESHPYG